MRNDDLALCLRAHEVWGTISRNPLEIETWVQWTTNRKWPIPSPKVTWLMTSLNPETSRSWPNICGAHNLDNGWRYGLGANGAPIGNDYLGIKWSRDRWRHATLKGQGRHANMLRARYLENGWRYTLGSNGPPIGNGPLKFEWSRNWWRHVTQKGQDRNIFIS